MSAAGGAGAEPIEEYKRYLIEPDVKEILGILGNQRMIDDLSGQNIQIPTLSLSRSEINEKIKEIRDYLFNATPLSEWFNSDDSAPKYRLNLALGSLKFYIIKHPDYKDNVEDTFNSVIAEVYAQQVGGRRRRIRKSRRAATHRRRRHNRSHAHRRRSSRRHH